jgi:hypothetical protein
LVTVIELAVDPLLQSREPVNSPAVRTELPQLFSTDTTGAEGIGLGDDVPLPGALVHPFIVCDTVYVLACVTVIDEDVDPLLHNKEPTKFPAVKTEFPQLFVTVTDGAGGIGLGEETPLPGKLTHPLAAVCVTV